MTGPGQPRAAGIDDRILERRAAVRGARRRVRLRRTLTVVVLVLLGVALWALERSALVGLEEVEVTGLQRLEVDEILGAADLELGTSTLRLRLARAAERVEALPLVRSAEARRQDPLTVVIEIEERRPALNVSGGGSRRVLDREGVLLLDGAVDGLPEIRLSGEPPAVGERAGRDATLANAHRAWRGLSGPLRREVVAYRAAGPDELDLELASGLVVRFGRADRVDEKVRALGALLDDLGDAEVEAVDVRAPGAPVVVGR